MKRAIISVFALAVCFLVTGNAQGTSSAAGTAAQPKASYAAHHEVDDLDFRPYELGSNEGKTVVDGRLTHDDGLGFPSFRNQGIPVTGWIKDDGKNLYVTLDMTLSRSRSISSDAALFIKQPNGVREYRLKDALPGFGKFGKFEIPKTKRQHGVFEFKIPLNDIHATQGNIELAFSPVKRTKG